MLVSPGMSHILSNFSTPFDGYCLTGPPQNFTEKYPPSRHIVITVWECLTGLICLVGSAANALLLIIILKNPLLRQGAAIFIAHLLTTHFLMCAIAIPSSIYMVNQVTVEVPGTGCRRCRFQFAVHVTFSTVTYWTDALLALNRIVAILLPSYFPLFGRKWMQAICLSVCWLATLIISIPPMFDVIGLYRMNPLGLCAITATSLAGSVLYNITAYLPLALTTAATVLLTVRYIFCHSSVRPSHAGRKDNDAPLYSFPSNASVTLTATSGGLSVAARAAADRRKRMSQMLMAAFVLSITCQLPLYIIGIGFPMVNARHPEVTLVFRFLAAFQFAFTPVLFFAMNKDYQIKAFKLCRPWRFHRKVGS